MCCVTLTAWPPIGHVPTSQIALLSSRPRQASVTATADTVCLSMDRKTFSRVVLPLRRVLQRDMDKYKEVIGQQV